MCLDRLCLILCYVIDWLLDVYCLSARDYSGLKIWWTRPWTRNFATESSTIKIYDYGDKENLQGQYWEQENPSDGNRSGGDNGNCADGIRVGTPETKVATLSGNDAAFIGDGIEIPVTMETPPTPPAPAVILNDLIEILPDDIKIDERIWSSNPWMTVRWRSL